MKLVRGWESQFAPDVTGGLQLSKARCYRDVDEEGVGDQKEGEVRARVPGELTINWQREKDFPVPVTKEMDDASVRQLWELLTDKEDDRDIEDQGQGKWKTWRNLTMEDSKLDSPYILCLSREPATKEDWERLRAKLPDKYDTWTIIEDVNSLKFEIECGIKRWLRLYGITVHTIEMCQGWVDYSYDAVPPSVNLEEIGGAIQIERWFRKGKQYKDQKEYRIAWNVQSPQLDRFPRAIGIELTRTGLDLFKPWNPPEH